MPVFDFNSAPAGAPKEPECTYTTYRTNAGEASAEKPILLLDNQKRRWDQMCIRDRSEREQYEFAPVDMGNIFHETLEAFSKKLDASDYTWRTLPQEVADEWVEECLASLTVDYGNTVLNLSLIHIL